MIEKIIDINRNVDQSKKHIILFLSNIGKVIMN